MPRMKDMTVERTMDTIEGSLCDVKDAIITRNRKGNVLTLTKPKGNYVSRQITIIVKEEKFDV